MATTTTLARGGVLCQQPYVDGWYGYVNSPEYTQEQQDALVVALLAAQRDAFDALLPADCHWYPTTSEIIGPLHASPLDSDDLSAWMEEAAAAAEERFPEIERHTLEGSP
jgi:hypothetical protein